MYINVFEYIYTYSIYIYIYRYTGEGCDMRDTGEVQVSVRQSAFNEAYLGRLVNTWDHNSRTYIYIFTYIYIYIYIYICISADLPRASCVLNS